MIVAARTPTDHTLADSFGQSGAVSANSPLTVRLLSRQSENSGGGCEHQPPSVPSAGSQTVDTQADCLVLLGTLGEALGRKGDYALRVVCPICGRTNLHGWDPRRNPPGKPQHRRAHCGCHPGGYYILPETRPLIGGRRGK